MRVKIRRHIEGPGEGPPVMARMPKKTGRCSITKCRRKPTEWHSPGQSVMANQLMRKSVRTSEAILILNRPYLIEGFASKLDFTEPT